MRTKARADRAERKCHKMIKGAIKSALHAHPGDYPDCIVNSIAKRVTGQMLGPDGKKLLREIAATTKNKNTKGV